MDIDKITKGLKCCTTKPEQNCEACPYYGEKDIGGWPCKSPKMKMDALELIKWQEGTIRGLESCLQETLEKLTNARKETETETSEHSMKQEDVAEIMNTINDALEGSGYCAVGYDNTGTFLQVLIEGTGEDDG